MSIPFSRTAVLGAVTVIGLLAVVFFGAQFSSAQPNVAASTSAPDPNHVITVVGQGTVKATPDIVRVDLGVEVYAATAKEAMTEASGRMEAILKTLQELKIAKQDIQTSNYSINFERNYEAGSLPETSRSEPGEPLGRYRVSNMVQVTIRDLDMTGQVIEAAVDAGANNMWGFTFAVDNPAPLESAARSKAMADARARAEELAKLAGVELGGVMTISEIGNSSMPFVPRAAEMAYGGGGGPIIPGELEFSAQVQVSYYIK